MRGERPASTKSINFMPKPTTNHDQAKSDHDLLIELVTVQKLNHEALLEKINGVQGDVKEVKDGQALQMAKFEARLVLIETLAQTKLAETSIAEWNAASDWVQSFSGRWKWIAGLIGLASAVFGWAINYLWPLTKGGQ